MQGAAKGFPASLSEVSPTLSGDPAERKLKNRKIDKSVPEPPEVDAVKKTNELRVRQNEMSAVSREKPSAHSEKHLVFAIPAPSKVNPSQRLEFTPVLKGKQPTSTSKAEAIKPGGKGESTSKAKAIKSGGKGKSASKAEAIKPEGKGESMARAKATHPEVKGKSPRVSSSSIAPVGSKQQVGTKVGAVSDVKKRKRENIPGTEGPREKILKPIERSNASVEREKPSELQKRADEGIARGSSPIAEQKPRGPIFKPKQDTWDVANLVPAIQNNRVLLLENLAPGLHSDDLAEALTEFFNHRCAVRIALPESFSIRTTSALLKFPTDSIAFKINESMNQRNVIVSGRLVTTRLFKYQDFKPKSSTPLGHIALPKGPGGRDYNNTNYRDAVATSHLAQGNTIEFDYGLSCRVLDEQHEEQWRMLQEEFNSCNKTTASKKMA